MPDTRQPAKELWDSLSAEKSAPKQPAELRAKQDELRSETRELREDQAELLEDQEQLTEKKEELARREKAVALRELELKLPPPDDDEAAGDDDSSTFSRLQRAWFGASLMSVSAFANDTVVYINSSMWYWYITLFVFSFKSTPLCDENLQQPASQCEDDLDGSQYYFGLTGFMFVVFALVNMLARYYESVDEERVWSSGACVAGSDHLTPLQRKLVTLRQMTGMCTGWALGDAFKRAHEQVLANAAVGGWEQELGITELQVNFGFATFVTIAAAAVVAVTRPNARGLVQCDSCVGGTKPARAPSKEGAGGRQHSAFLRLRLVERYATTVFALVAKAVATAVMVIWTKVLSAWVVQGLDRRGAVPEGCAVDEVAMNELYEVDEWHTRLFWAIAITYVGSVLSFWLGSFEERRGSKSRQLERAVVDLMQRTFGWVTGCAWTDVAVAALDLDPREMYPMAHHGRERMSDVLGDLTRHALGAALLTALCVVLMAMFLQDADASDSAETARREAVERTYITGAMSFFVGWAWIIAIRDLCIVWMLVYLDAYPRLGLGPEPPELLGLARGSPVVFLAVLLLTLIIFVAKHRIIGSYTKLQAEKQRRRHISQLKRCFRVFDLDKDGNIDTQDLARIMVALGARFTEEQKEQLTAAFTTFDLDKDGKVSVAEVEAVLDAAIGAELSASQVDQLLEHGPVTEGRAHGYGRLGDEEAAGRSGAIRTIMSLFHSLMNSHAHAEEAVQTKLRM